MAIIKVSKTFVPGSSPGAPANQGFGIYQGDLMARSPRRRRGRAETLDNQKLSEFSSK